MKANTVSMVIGSWGSYNECNKRALGSKWLDFDDYDDWDEIVEELKKEGFELNGIDEELFVQDIEGIPTDSKNWDCTHPKEIFELIKKSGILNCQYKYDIFKAYLEIYSFSDFENLVEQYDDRWDDNIHLYKDMDWEDYGRQYFDECCYQIPDNIIDFIDFERYGEYIGGDCAYECSEGIIEIFR